MTGAVAHVRHAHTGPRTIWVVFAPTCHTPASHNWHQNFYAAPRDAVGGGVAGAALWCARDQIATWTLVVVMIQCNTLLHSATHCNALQRTATHCNALQRTATHCNALQHSAARCHTLQHTATLCKILQHCATYCDTMRHTATHCNAL